jgi:hypothetical protein
METWWNGSKRIKQIFIERDFINLQNQHPFAQSVFL